MGELRYGATILDLGARWRWVVSFTPQLLSPLGKSPQYSLYRRLVGPQSPLYTVIRRISCPCRESNPGSPAHSPSLYRLSYPGSFLYRKNNIFPVSKILVAVNMWVRSSGCTAAYFRESLTFRNNASPSSSRSKSKPNSACCLLLLVCCLT
jgi:hypothetical protein